MDIVLALLHFQVSLLPIVSSNPWEPVQSDPPLGGRVKTAEGQALKVAAGDRTAMNGVSLLI